MKDVTPILSMPLETLDLSDRSSIGREDVMQLKSKRCILSSGNN